MKDWLFYPLVALVAVALIVFALTRGGVRTVVTEADALCDGYTLWGAELMDLTASPGTELLVGEASARALMVQDRAGAPPSAGVFATLPPVYEGAFAGRDIAVEWRVRMPGGAGEVEIGYFTLGAGDSPWIKREVGEDWTDIAIGFRPRAVTEPGFDYAGLWPGVGEPDGKAVEIESVSVRVAQRPADCATRTASAAISAM